jgi:hypothetical protein
MLVSGCRVLPTQCYLDDSINLFFSAIYMSATPTAGFHMVILLLCVQLCTSEERVESNTWISSSQLFRPASENFHMIPDQVVRSWKSLGGRTPLFHSFVLLAQLYGLGSTDRWCCQSAKPQIVCQLAFMPNFSRLLGDWNHARRLAELCDLLRHKQKQRHPAIGGHNLRHRSRDVSPGISFLVGANHVMVANLSYYLLSSSSSSFLPIISPAHINNGRSLPGFRIPQASATCILIARYDCFKYLNDLWDKRHCLGSQFPSCMLRSALLNRVHQLKQIKRKANEGCLQLHTY